MASLQTPSLILDLLAQLVKQVTTLWTIEVDLLRAELAESSSRAIGGIAKIAVGAVFLLAGFFFLLAALAALLVRLGLPVDVSCLIVAVVALGGGGLLIRAGANAFAARSLLPRRSIDQISSLIGRH